MNTKIFKDYAEFLNRKDQSENGVSEHFASKSANWEVDNSTNEGCWNCSGCRGCRGCSDCSYCRGKKNLKFDSETECKPFPAIPKIENIHSKVLKAVKADEYKLEMDGWHKDEKIEKGAHCGTTHCRAGFVVFLAGKAGYELEKATSTEFAAKQIYKASSKIPVSPVRFFEPNEIAMADIERCAELERLDKVE
jgi:hypothetical protein